MPTRTEDRHVSSYSGRHGFREQLAGKECAIRPNPCFHWDATQAMSQHRDVNPKEPEVQRHPGGPRHATPI